MKAISTIIATILLVVITIGLVSTAYLFVGGVLKGTTTEVFEIISISNDRVIIRNRGTKTIEDFNVVVDGNEVDYVIEGGSIEPNNVGTIILDIQKGEHELVLGSRSMSMKWKWRAEDTVASYLVGYWKFDEGSSSTAYDSSPNNNNGDIYASGRNQIKNPSFEMGKQDWGTGGGTWDIVMDEKYHGVNSSRLQDLIMDSSSETAGYVYLPVTPGKSFNLSLYSKGDNIQNPGGPSWYKALLIGRWLNSTGGEVPGSCCPDLLIGDGLGTWNWKRSSNKFTPPASAVNYRFSLNLPGNTTGTLWTDAVQFEYGILTEFTDSPWTSGKFGSALEFDGIDDYVDVGNPSSLQLIGDMTISFWTYPTNVTEARENPIDKAYCGEFALTQETDGRLSYFQGPNGGEVEGYMSRSWSNVFVENQWIHVAIVRDVSEHSIKLYKIGVDQGEGGIAWANPSASSQPVTIGDGYAGSGYHGIIDEVRIYNRTLTQQEIQTIMNEG